MNVLVTESIDTFYISYVNADPTQEESAFTLEPNTTPDK